MGFFSWKSNDTNRSIGNIYGDLDKVFTVYMKDDKGNVWTEDAYEGYGEFGGKDFYELVAEINGHQDPCRAVGIEMAFRENKEGLLFPNLVEDINTEWKNEEPENCEYQGFFYPEEAC